MDYCDDFFERNEEAHTGSFKMIRTIEDYWSAVKADRFLGTAWCFENPRRVESTELVSYIGEFKVDSEGRQVITNVDFSLKIPKIPYSLLRVIIDDFKSHPTEERIFQVRWDVLAKEYVIVKPTEFRSSKCAIEYVFENIPSQLKPILEIHSHNTMQAYFSKTDDNDELLHGFYGVVGTVDAEPTMRFRVGMEGFFTEIPTYRLFDLEM